MINDLIICCVPRYAPMQRRFMIDHQSASFVKHIHIISFKTKPCAYVRCRRLHVHDVHSKQVYVNQIAENSTVCVAFVARDAMMRYPHSLTIFNEPHSLALPTHQKPVCSVAQTV